MTEKGELEEKLKQMLGRAVQATDLSEKLKNVIRGLKTEMEKRALDTVDINLIISYHIEKEGIINDTSFITSALQNPIFLFFNEKFKPKSSPGMYGGNIFFYFENTPLDEEMKREIQLYKEMESKIDAYVKECYGKPDPKAFRDFVYSSHPDDVSEKIKRRHYDLLREKYSIEEFREKETKPMKNLMADIQSQLKNIDLSDV